MAGERTRAPGELEAAVMGVLWDSDAPLTSSQILDRIPGRRPAQTTLLTALDRLCRKGRIRRIGEAARGMRFQPIHTEAEHTSESMLDALGESHDRSGALLKFAGDLSADDLTLLADAIARRRRQP